MAGRIAALWRGEMPLGRAFWEYAILYGLIASAVATAGSLLAVGYGLPGPVAFAIHLLPTPYLLCAALGVERSARNHHGSRFVAQIAPPVAYLWALLMAVV